MTEDRKRARLERFRGALIERARKMTARLLDRAQGQGAIGDEHEVARELHTFKGDARMLGLGDIADCAHAAETLLLSEGNVRVHGPRIVEALDRVIAALEGRIGDDAAQTAELKRVVAGLLSASAGDGAQSASLAVPASAADSPQAAPALPAAGMESRLVATEWINVEATRVDDVCEGVTDFAFELRALLHRTRRESRPGAVLSGRELFERLESMDRLASRMDALVDRSWSLRLTTIEPLLQDLARHARELAAEQGKLLRTTVRAGAVELERSTCNSLWDPLLHLVRNAIDHGVETPADRGARGKAPEASLLLSAEPRGPNVTVEVYDDGRGVDTGLVRRAAISRGLLSDEEAFALEERDAIDLIFRHGFSTRSEVGELSGRGVGLDVVRHSLERLGGSVRVVSDLGEGTRFFLDVPARIGKERALVVECAGGLYAVPSRSIREIVRLPGAGEDLGEALLRHGPDQLPLVSMEVLLRAERTQHPPRFALIIEVQNRRWACAVTTVLGEHELIRRPVDELLGGSELIGAAATLPDGRLVLVVSPSELVRRSGHGGIVPVPRADLQQEPENPMIVA